MTSRVKITKFYGDRCFVLSLEAFQFSRFYESEAKHDKRNCKRGLGTTFEVKIRK